LIGKNANLSFFAKMIQYSEPKSDLRRKYVKDIWKTLTGFTYNDTLDGHKKELYENLENVEIKFPSERKKVKNMLEEITK